MNWTKSALWIAFFTSLSRILGLVREMLMSFILGTGVVAEAFIVAFKFPNFFRRFFAEGAFNAAFIPYITTVFVHEGKEHARESASQIFTFFFWILLCFVVFVEMFTPYLMHIIAPGFEGKRLDLAISFTRLTFPYIAFVSLSALLAGLLNAIDRFKTASFIPIILNVWMISALTWTMVFKVKSPGALLSLSVLLAGLTQLIWLFVQCYRYNFFPVFVRQINHGRIVALKMIPGMLGAGVIQLNIFIDMMFASFLPLGSIGYLYYADRLVQLPLSLIGVTLSTVMLPKLTKLYQQKKESEVRKLQNDMVFISFLVSLPASLGLMILSYPIIDVFFAHGAFKGVSETALALMGFSLGLPAYIISKLLSTIFFAQSNTKTPVQLAIFCVGFNLILNVCLIPFCKHVGLALATAISAWIYVLLLSNKLNYHLFSLSNVKSIAGRTILVGGMLLFVQSFLSSSILQLMILSVLGVLFYCPLGYMLYKKKVLPHNMAS